MVALRKFCCFLLFDLFFLVSISPSVVVEVLVFSFMKIYLNDLTVFHPTCLQPPPSAAPMALPVPAPAPMVEAPIPAAAPVPAPAPVVAPVPVPAPEPVVVPVPVVPVEAASVPTVPPSSSATRTASAAVGVVAVFAAML
jgi:hypothetical protein